ncbi:hypothetical protein MMC19_006914 [Ptychographa xylographoides]|nr:hypothetical protein [Ptychographa xylographoides]
MAITSYLLPVLGVVSRVAAASCSIDSTSTTTIVNPAGASALAACTTYSGNVMLASGVASNQNTVNLNGIQEITGSLSYMDDSSVTSFEAGDLESVGDLSFGNLSEVSTLSMSSLNTVADLNFTGLGSLGSFTFGTPGIQKAGNVLVTNTVLTSLQGINALAQVAGFSISNNPYLSTIELDVTAISGAVDIGANDVTNGGQTVNFPNLQTAGQLTFRNSSKVSLPMLSNVSQNLGFYDNLFDNLATPNLTFAGGIVFVDNTQLTNISMPMLTTINGSNGTYQIANNTLLKSIDGFENLENVKGGLDFTGNFTSVHLPKLQNVGGAMNVQTSATFDCDPINALGNTGNQVVKGAITCAGSQSSPGSSTSGSPSSGGSSSSSSSGAAVPGVTFPVALGGTSILGMLLQFLLSF